MTLRTALPAAWQRQARWLWLLWPLSLLYGLLFYLNRLLYRAGWRASYRAPVPVWVIGNLTAGGNGKTPLLAYLYERLSQDGWQVVVISRGYGGRGPFPRIVQPDDDAGQAGDEPLMLARQGLRVAVGPNRRQVIELALSQWPQTDLILSDDGLQHHALQHDLAWVVIDSKLGYGNGQLLPAGPLREYPAGQPAPRIWHVADALQAQQRTAPAMWLEAGNWMPLQPGQTSLPPVRGELVQAVAGIGQPARFFATLRAMGLVVVEWPFPDHHDYQQHELAALSGQQLVTTSKDAVKLQALGVQGWILPVTVQLNAAAEALLQRSLQQLKALRGHGQST